MADKQDHLAVTKRSEERPRTLDSVVRENLLRWVGIFGREVTQIQAQIYIEGLRDLPASSVEAGFRRVEREFKPTAACPFPVIAHIREAISLAQANERSVVAEEKWQQAFDWVRHFYLGPDIGVAKDAPRLDRQLERALNAAGGMELISSCPLDELQWAKKRFLEAYESISRLAEDENFISNAEAKKILYETIPQALKKLQE